MTKTLSAALATLPGDQTPRERMWTLSVIVGTCDSSRAADPAPKHLAIPMSRQNYLGFVGVVRTFVYSPHLVAGGAANTEAGAELVARLTGLEVLDLLHESSPCLRWVPQARLANSSAGH